MFKKIFSLVIGMLLIALFITNVSEAQTKKVQYPLFSISPLVGVQFPIGSLNDAYATSYNFGLDLALKVNKETSFYIKGGYYNMPRKTDVPVGPDASMIEITAGPRYTFASPQVKAQFFLEAGLGVYMFNYKEFTTASIPGVLVPSSSKTEFGVNAGPGITIPLGGPAELMMKSKIHYLFQEGGGSKTFITAAVGVDFRL
jgi:hypothetical protein